MKYDRTVIAYHGCDAAVANRVLSGEPFRPSENDYDWLGAGIYFWEYGYDRALRFAASRGANRKVKHPAVVGAILQLGNCFDLMDTRFTNDLREAYDAFQKSLPEGRPMPENKGGSPDWKLRRLDCAVLNFYFRTLEEDGIDYDSVRCAFIEGRPVFPGSGIRGETHIQVAVRNSACVIGTFRPMMEES